MRSKEASSSKSLPMADSISMTWPRPPRRRPWPPEPGRSSLRQNTTGETDSLISTGVPRTPLG